MMSTHKKNKSALIVLNLQNDYCDETVMGIVDVLTIIPIINKIRNLFDYVIFVKDWHPKYHSSFKDYGGSYPIHCVQNSVGAELNPGLIVNDTDLIIHKGTLEMHDSDSAFYNAAIIEKESNLRKILEEHNILNLYFCGVMPEQFVFSTVMDAVRFKYSCTIIKDLCLGINNENAEIGYKYLEKLDGVYVTDWNSVVKQRCLCNIANSVSTNPDS